MLKVAVRPEPSEAVAALSPVERDLLILYSQFDAMMNRMVDIARELTAKHPSSEEARLLLADVLLAGGRPDLAKQEYEKASATVGVNQKRRIAQAIQQCDTDQDYFPPALRKTLESAVYADGFAAGLWRNYAQRDVQRAREIARLVRRRVALPGRRVLDVGCSYGGTLIAFAEQGADVWGVEIDADRIAVGRQRLADLGMHAEIRQADICKLADAADLGTFDVITLQDVIEHVLDPEDTIRKLSALLKPGGIIYVKVGNKYSLDQLQGDHHFRLPGMTVISRAQAMEYFHVATGEPESTYDVGFWKTAAWYTRIFARYRVRLEQVESYGSPNVMAWYALEIQKIWKRAGEEIHPRLRPALQERIRRRMMVVARYYAAMGRRVMEAQSNPALTAQLCDRAVKRVCAPVWQFIGTKAAQAYVSG